MRLALQMKRETFVFRGVPDEGVHDDYMCYCLGKYRNIGVSRWMEAWAIGRDEWFSASLRYKTCEIRIECIRLGAGEQR